MLSWLQDMSPEFGFPVECTHDHNISLTLIIGFYILCTFRVIPKYQLVEIVDAMSLVGSKLDLHTESMRKSGLRSYRSQVLVPRQQLSVKAKGKLSYKAIVYVGNWSGVAKIFSRNKFHSINSSRSENKCVKGIGGLDSDIYFRKVAPN